MQSSMLLVLLAMSTNAQTTPKTCPPGEVLKFGSCYSEEMISSAPGKQQPSPSSVRENDSKVSTELLLGLAVSRTKITLSAEDNLASNGLAIGGRFMAKVSPIVSIGAELQTLSMGEHTSNSLITSGISTSKFSSLVFLGEIKIAAQSGSIRPYGIAGVGFHSTSIKIDSTPQAGFVWANTGTRETRSAVDSRKTAAAFTFQAGVDVPINEKLSFGLAGSWYHLGEANYESTAVARQTLPSFLGIKGSISATALLATIAYRF